MTTCILKERRDLYLKHSRLELSHEQLQQEYKRLQERQTKATQSIQQKSNLKALLLESKINAMTEIHEKKQLELWVALAFRQLDRSVDNIKEYDDLVRKAQDLGICADKSLQCRYSPVDHMTTGDLMKELISLSISERESDQKDARSLSLAAAEFRQWAPTALGNL
ncbi:uncharacterized protein LOC129349084 isoform X2 [Amphiprion ocellaris]|uniref:uncharacterized protein LOC129349084 isoform X2 n=1 Tax=Amphiprion ocellaris TaxID=80972 RepID=UPI0024116F9C|nr:uncharacterized protein LOC129349084 isoform X2 [Amphiprion ocellaris]